MTITQARNKIGTLTLNKGGTSPGELAMETQTTNVAVEAKTKAGKGQIEVLSGEVINDDATTEWTLKGKQIQDFSDPEGIQAYSWTNAGETVPFEWCPNGAGSGKAKITGNVTISPLTIGGEVAVRLDNDIEWTIVGTPTLTYTA